MKKNKILAIGIGSLLIFALTLSVGFAAEIRVPKDKEGANVTINEGESSKNLYTAGNIISINGTIEGDLVAVGGVVNLNGDVEDDIMVAAGTVLIKNTIGGSARVAGGNILIDAIIADDLIVAGGNITISRDAQILGDLIIAGGNIDISGSVAGYIRGAGGTVVLNNTVGGQVKLDVEELELGPKASIGGNLTYKSTNEAKINEAAYISGEIDFTKAEKGSKFEKPDKGILLGLLGLAWLIKMLMAMVLGIVLVYLMRRLTEQIVNNSLARFWPSLGLGFSALILTPVLIIILLITILGIGVAGLLGAIYMLFMALAAAVAQIILGTWLMKMLKKDEEYKINWLTVVVGVIAANLAMLIPFVGWLVGLVFMLLALGSVFNLAYMGLIKKQS